MPTDHRAHPLAPIVDGVLAVTAEYERKVRRRQVSPAFRRTWHRARRLAIVRRRQRIASKPRMGDVVYCADGRMLIFLRCLIHGNVVVRDPAGYPRYFRPEEWRELVRRARVTQEAT